jgi:hypothetical protein
MSLFQLSVKYLNISTTKEADGNDSHDCAVFAPAHTIGARQLVHDLAYTTVIFERVHLADSKMMLAAHGTGEKSSSRIYCCIVETLLSSSVCNGFCGVNYV